MKTHVDQYCVNVTNLHKSVHFYETVLGLKITHRVETPDFREAILSGENGDWIQLACHRAQKRPIDPGNGAGWAWPGLPGPRRSIRIESGARIMLQPDDNPLG